ncbi:unnamed protein product, partial [Brachionus calyciflorus]
CNCIQFNGSYGCIKCLHPCLIKNHTLYYPTLPNILLRSNEEYSLLVNKAVSDNTPFKGIKGFSVLSKWINIPDDIIYDYMYL